MIQINIDWEKVWDELDDWYREESKDKQCPTCKHIEKDPPEWEEQQQQIEKIVNKILNPILTRKKNKTKSC